MDSNSQHIIELGKQGYCCSQIMIILGLEIQETASPELVQAASGLCRGLYSGETCGILTGAACMLSLFDKETAAAWMIPELVAWFKEEYTPLYGGIRCTDIMGGDIGIGLTRCPEMMAATYAKALEILDHNGFIDRAYIP